MGMDYEHFLESKKIIAQSFGFEKPRELMNSNLFDWQKDVVYWALKKGKCALFEGCGLGKTIQQLEWAKSVTEHCNKPVLIVAPLAVAEQTKREGEKFGYVVSIIRGQEQIQNGINITNYEILSHFDESSFCGVVLDESSILKNFTGKTRTEIIEKFRYTPYKLSCTATPSPNDYMELGNQAEFCGVMSRSEMLSTYFIHDGGNTSKWRLKGHAKDKFWEWISSWAVVLTNPCDLGYDGKDFVLPELMMYEHVVKSNNYVIDGNYSIIPNLASTLSERRIARKDSIIDRCKVAKELVESDPQNQWIIWCDLNAESEILHREISDSVEIRGSDHPEDKSMNLMKFTKGDIKYLVTKGSIAGMGLNWQNCHNMIFVGLSDSYEMMYQSIRRCWRFGQKEKVNVHIIISESDGNVKLNIERKEKQANEMQKEMLKYTKEILKSEIIGTQRISIPYNPKIKMKLPKWLILEDEL